MVSLSTRLMQSMHVELVIPLILMILNTMKRVSEPKSRAYQGDQSGQKARSRGGKYAIYAGQGRGVLFPCTFVVYFLHEMVVGLLYFE